MTEQVPYCVLAVPLLLQLPLWKDSCLLCLHIFVEFQLPEAFPETSCARCHKETHCLCEGHYDEQCSAGQSEKLFPSGYRAHPLSLLLCLPPSFCETYGWLQFTEGTDNFTRSAGFRKPALYYYLRACSTSAKIVGSKKVLSPSATALVSQRENRGPMALSG